MDLDSLLRHAVDGGASDVHLKVGQPPILRHDGALQRGRRLAAAHRAAARRGAGHGHGTRLGAARDLRPDRRPRPRLHASRPSASARQRLPPARRDLVRVPRDPEQGARLRRPRPARGDRAAGRRAARPRPLHRRDGIGEDDHARGDHRAHQRHAPVPHRHDRGPDRDPARRPARDRQPARDRAGHALVQRGPPPGAAPGPRRDPDRRDARRRDGADRDAGGRVGPPRPLDPAHDGCGRVDRPDRRVLPAPEAPAGAVDPGRRAPRRDQPAAAAAPRPRPCPRRRGDGRERPDRRPDPREPGGRDRGRDRRRRVLQDADLHAGTDRARARRPCRPRGGRERRRQQARLPRRPRPRRQGAGRGGAQGCRGGRPPATRPACAWCSGRSREATRPSAGRRPALDRRGRDARRRLDLLRRHGTVGSSRARRCRTAAICRSRRPGTCVPPSPSSSRTTSC